jgi:ABC-type uncharacterized transport system auxiliary subunit
MKRQAISSPFTGTVMVLLLLFTAAACSMKLGTPAPAVVSYVLRDPGAGAAPTYTHTDQSLLIREVNAPALIGNRRMIFSRTPHTRQAYQYASWTEPVATRLTTLLTDRLAASGIFSVVTRRGVGILTNLQLAVELREFYHDAANKPGTARLKIDARLVDTAASRIVARQQFQAAAPLPSYDAAGAATALSNAVSTVMDDLTIWLAATVDARTQEKGVARLP